MNRGGILLLRTLFSLLGLGQEGLFHSMFFSFDQLNNSGTVDVKKLSLSLSKNSLFKLGFSFSPRPAWGYYVVSGKNWLQKKWSLDSFYKVFFSEVAICLYKFTIWSCREYCCHVWAVAPNCYFDKLDKLQK